VTFTGEIDTACDLNVSRPGELALSADGKVLSSRADAAAGGVSGLVTVQADENFEVSIEAPTLVANSPDGDLSAATVGQLGQTDVEVGTPVAAPVGNSELTVDLEIERSGGGDLSAGDFSASVLVNCESAAGPVSPQ
jgi:hypothetical protein